MSKLTKLMIVGIMILTGCSTNQLYTASTSLLIADYSQTHDISHREEFIEANPILGKHPDGSDVREYFGAVLLAYSLLATYLPEVKKRQYLWSVIVIECAVVIHNMRAGVDFMF